MTDILLSPTNPVSQSWQIRGLTCEGREFVKKFARSGVVKGRIRLSALRILWEAKGLKMSKDWSTSTKTMEQVS